MLTCKELDALADYLCAELPWPTRFAMRLHLLICGKCRAYVRGYRRTIDLARTAFNGIDREAPESVSRELVETVLAKSTRQKRP